jgi:hypothetical protein
MTSFDERVYIGTHLTLITERSDSGPGVYVRGVEFDGVTGMTGDEDRDWPALDPAFGLAKKLGCEGIWFQHAGGVEFVTQSAESAKRCRELAKQLALQTRSCSVPACPGNGFRRPFVSAAAAPQPQRGRRVCAERRLASVDRPGPCRPALVTAPRFLPADYAHPEPLNRLAPRISVVGRRPILRT